MPIDHYSLSVSEADFQDCLEFYLAALGPLGYELRHQYGESIVGLGCKDQDFEGYKSADFWILGVKEAPKSIAHIAFRANDRQTVDDFYKKGLEAGGKDNGPPGLRMYHASYYGAYVTDPAGNNIETVCHRPA